jgi:hypothetical protein
MLRLATALTALTVAVSLAGCGGSPPPPPAAATAAPAAPSPVPPGTAPAPAAPSPALVRAITPVPTAPPTDYESRGRRDPFTNPEPERPTGGLTVTSAKLTGILRGGNAPLALVETPDGLGYILKPGDTLGDGRLVDIGRDAVVFAVVPKPGTTDDRVTLKLPGD